MNTTTQTFFWLGPDAAEAPLIAAMIPPRDKHIWQAGPYLSRMMAQMRKEAMTHDCDGAR
jgi:hypothetical protein